MGHGWGRVGPRGFIWYPWQQFITCSAGSNKAAMRTAISWCWQLPLWSGTLRAATFGTATTIAGSLSLLHCLIGNRVCCLYLSPAYHQQLRMTLGAWVYVRPSNNNLHTLMLMLLAGQWGVAVLDGGCKPWLQLAQVFCACCPKVTKACVKGPTLAACHELFRPLHSESAGNACSKYHL